MKARSSLKKRFRELIANSKGFSSVIGTVFMVLVMMFMSTSVFLWTLSQNATYNQAVRESNQLDIDRLREKMVASSGGSSVVGDDVQVAATLKNEGPISAEILTLWVATIDKYNCTDSFSPGSVTSFNPGDSGAIYGTVEIDGITSDDAIDIWFVTARGNIVPFEVHQYITISNMTQVLGPILMDFESFRWYSHESGNNGTWRISKSETKLEWFVTVTNFGSQTLTLKYESAFALLNLNEANWGNAEKIWHIREECVLPLGEQVEIGFCWTSPNGGSYSTKDLGKDGTCATFLLLIGDWADGGHFGENVPFTAVYIEP